jgi:hypothetical protein
MTVTTIQTPDRPASAVNKIQASARRTARVEWAAADEVKD